MAEGSVSMFTCPPEIRALVFANVVTFTKPLVHGVSDEDGRSIASQLSLLLTNKAVHEEAAALFYELNTFRFVLPSQWIDSNFDEVVPMETKCAQALTVPTRFINRLRHVVFYKPLQGYWPNGPLTDSALGPEGLGEKELAVMLDSIAEHSAILTSISVRLQRVGPVAFIQWDTDPLVLLSELDRGQRFSSIVERLPQLQRLEIWKGRKCVASSMALWQMFPEGGVERGEKYAKAVEEAKLEQVREEHFRGVKSARYERRAWGAYVETQNGEDDLFMAEGFVLNFTDRDM